MEAHKKLPLQIFFFPLTILQTTIWEPLFCVHSLLTFCGKNSTKPGLKPKTGRGDF